MNRTLGMTAIMNGRSCNIKVGELHESHHDCKDHAFEKRQAQWPLIDQQMEEEAQHRAKLSRSRTVPASCYASMRRHYGRKPGPPLLEGVDVDHHKQSWWDPAHLLLFGVIKLIIKTYLKSMSDKQREEFQIRLRDYPWPSGTPSPIQAIKAKFGSGVSMTAWKNIAFASLHCLQGLVTDAQVKFLVTAVRFRAKCMQPLSASDIEQLEITARKVVDTRTRTCTYINMTSTYIHTYTHTHTHT